jgi:hypothetical protein
MSSGLVATTQVALQRPTPDVPWLAGAKKTETDRIQLTLGLRAMRLAAVHGTNRFEMTLRVNFQPKRGVRPNSRV